MPLATSRRVATSGRDAHAVGRVGEQAHLVVDDAGHRVAGERRPEVVQLRERRGVEGPRRDSFDTERPEAPAHLARRLRGEGDRHDASGRVGAGVDAVGDAMRDDPGLAGAGAGEHDDRVRAGSSRPRAAARRGPTSTSLAHRSASNQSVIRRWAIDAAPGQQQVALAGEAGADLVAREPAHVDDLLAVGARRPRRRRRWRGSRA